MNKASVRAAEAALERLVQSSPTASESADAVLLRDFLSRLKHMAFIPDWGVHADGHTIPCNDRDDALSLLDYCLTHKPDGGAYLAMRDHLRGEWVSTDANAPQQETHHV